METYSVYLFVTISIWLVKCTTSQEVAKEMTSNNRVIGLVIGFLTLLALIAIFVGLWCFCSYSAQNKPKENILPIRKVSVIPMELQEKTLPDKVDKIEDDGAQKEL